MEFGADTWWLVATLATVAVGIISYFLKRTMSKQDRHEEDINHIKLTYVTRDQLKEFKEETNNGINKLQKDIENIKENTLKKSDFLRQQANTERMIERLEKNTDKKLDSIYDVVLKIGGKKDE